jgi:SpoVK/Ycf46/Vps4 family AAA+-type ATPase
MATTDQRLALCRSWVATSTARIRRRLQMATQVRQALAAGLTREEAQLSVEATAGDVRRMGEEILAVEAEAARCGVELPIAHVARQAELDAVDVDVLVLSIAPHVDVEIRDAIARFNDNLLANYVDVRLLLEFLADDPVDRLALRARFHPDGAVLAARLCSLERPRDGSSDNLLGYEVVPSARVLQLLLGETGLLDASMGGMARFERPTVTLDDVVIGRATIEPMLVLLEQYVASGELKAGGSPFDLPAGMVVELSGPPGTGKSMLVRAICNHLGLPLLEVDAQRLHEMHDDSFRRTLQSAIDQARLAGLVLVLDGIDGLLGKAAPRISEVADMLRGHAGITILISKASGELDLTLDRFIVQRVMLETPNSAERERIFEQHKPVAIAWGDDLNLTELAGTYQFPGALIRNAMQVAVNRALAADPKAPRITHNILRKACHEQIRASLDEYAVKRKVGLTLENLIVPNETMEDIEELFTAARYRGHVLHNWGFNQRMSTGKGLVALFSGDPGTGKTLCATILANELDLELFQISIPRVVSKWIGETEKNIENIFKTARANHGMLLFDEADSLFAKRTKVESSVDRYSNMATNMLLQEIENFEGVVLLTTNIEKNIDDAFKRRIGFKIHFPFPEGEMRARIWRSLVPAECPVDPDTDWDEVGARYELSGGHIKNAVLRAAYQAAAAESALSNRHLEYAARQECKNAGRVFRAAGEHDLIGY